MSLPRSRTTFHSASFVGPMMGATTDSSNAQAGSAALPPSSNIDSAVASATSGTRARAVSTLPPPVAHTRTRRSFPIGLNKYTLFLIRRLLSRPLLWVVVVLLTLVAWWSNTGTHNSSRERVQLRLRHLFPSEVTRDLQFYPASNHKIHYVGRWTTAPNRLRIDGTFPGVYFEVNITNTSTLILNLQNAPLGASKPVDLHRNELSPTGIPTTNQYSFSAASRLNVDAAPISLLALVDGEEYVVLPNATSMVQIRRKDLDPTIPHVIRIIAPMTDCGPDGIVQFNGLWLDKGGYLQPVEGSLAETHADEEDDMDEEGGMVGQQHRQGLGRVLQNYNQDQVQRTSVVDEAELGGALEYSKRKKLVEIITDAPSHLGQRRAGSGSRSGGSDGLLAGVMGWEYLLGEMFSVDHVSIAAEGMCLTHDCVGGTGSPSGMGDVFFRSGPVGNSHFSHPWAFQGYVPDVLVMNLGTSDHLSFENRLDEYNKTAHELRDSFQDTYVSLVKSIRSLAYPVHPATVESQRLGLEAIADTNSPANIPIFIMRPFRGEMEHATQNVVNRLREDGDKSIFWLDTSGWLDEHLAESSQADFFTDASDNTYLTERGNQKVAIYLHMHTCRYLAAEDEKCAFLPPEVYQGNVFDPSQATFDQYIENEKERQMKQIFWENQ